jgi:malate dehydrogenase
VKVSIIGAAGTVGSCTAFAIATQCQADELVMMDLNQNLVESHVMDIGTAATLTGNIEVRSGQDEDLAGSDVVIMTASAPYRFIKSRMELLGENLPIVQDAAKKIKRYCPDAVVITATNPIDPLNYAMHLYSGLDRKRLIGYPFNDSIRFRMMAARALGVKYTQVEGIAIGEHGEHQVLLFSSLRVDGKPVTVDEDFKQSIRQEIPNILRSYESLGTGRTAGWTSAVGLAAVVSAIAGDSGQVLPCSVVLTGEYGYNGLSMSVPVILGREGVKQILEWELAPDEQEGLKRAADILKAAAQSIEDTLGQGRH